MILIFNPSPTLAGARYFWPIFGPTHHGPKKFQPKVSPAHHGPKKIGPFWLEPNFFWPDTTLLRLWPLLSLTIFQPIAFAISWYIFPILQIQSS